MVYFRVTDTELFGSFSQSSRFLWQENIRSIELMGNFFRIESLFSSQLTSVPSLTLLTPLFTLYILNIILLFTHLPFLLTVRKCPVALPVELTFNAKQALE